MNPTLLNGSVAVAPAYEQLLSDNPRWALAEGSRHFDEKSAVFDALRKIAARLDQLGVPYAVVGGMALFRHGYRRFTEDVDVLVAPQDLKTIHEKLEGLGYLPPHRRSRHLRDTELGVRIEFLTVGDYPGDGKKKPVAFPPPADVSFEADGVRYVNLETLIELKLASGMTSPGRLRDLSDVLELIRVLNLPEDYSQSLDPYVREKFAELWRQSRKRYVMLWRDAAITADVKTMDEFISRVADGADTLREMQQRGVILDEAGPGYARLATTDAEAAERFDMVDESEFWEDAE
jgi:hypothetical protein